MKNSGVSRVEDLDIFELASIRGKNVNDLEEMWSDNRKNEARVQEAMKMKKSRRDYERLNSIALGDIVMKTEEITKKTPLEDEFKDKNIIKI